MLLVFNQPWTWATIQEQVIILSSLSQHKEDTVVTLHVALQLSVSDYKQPLTTHGKKSQLSSLSVMTNSESGHEEILNRVTDYDRNNDQGIHMPYVNYWFMGYYSSVCGLHNLLLIEIQQYCTITNVRQSTLEADGWKLPFDGNSFLVHGTPCLTT